MFGSRFRKRNADPLSGFLGSQTEFTGKLSFAGVVHLDGNFDGEIISRGTLVVGSESSLRAQVHANVLKIAGEVHGDLTATEKIELYPPAKVYGNIRTPVLVVEEGVLFEGTCRMSSVREEVPALAEIEPESASEEDRIEAISAQAWPPADDEDSEVVQGASDQDALHKHSRS